MCHDHVFDVLFHVFPLLILFRFVFGEGRYKHREMKYLRQKWDFTLESAKNYLCIRYVFEEPKTCIFDYSFAPKILQIKSIIHLQMFISLQNKYDTGLDVGKTVPEVTRTHNALSGSLYFCFEVIQKCPTAWIK